MKESWLGEIFLSVCKATFPLLRFQMSPFSYHSVFGWSWAVSITPFSPRAPGTKTGVFPLLRFRSFSFPLFALVLKPRMMYRLLLLAFSNDSVFGVSIENDAFSDVSVFKSLHFEQRFQMSPFSIVFNGNTNPKSETFHSVFIRKRSNGNGA